VNLLLGTLIALNVATLVAGVVLYRRSRSAVSARAVVEAQAAHAARHVLELESRERWRALDTDGLHPLNRQEVVRLLARLDDASGRALSRQERDFLDRMVESERRVRSRASGSGPGGAPAPSGA
jgi:hypothetical protein